MFKQAIRLFVRPATFFSSVAVVGLIIGFILFLFLAVAALETHLGKKPYPLPTLRRDVGF